MKKPSITPAVAAIITLAIPFYIILGIMVIKKIPLLGIVMLLSAIWFGYILATAEKRT